MKFKRSLSFILCLMMLISVIPAQVFADEGDIEDEEIISFEEIIAADDFEEEPVDEEIPGDTLEDEEVIEDEEAIEDEEIPEDEEIFDDGDEIPEEPEIEDEDAEEAEDEDEDEEDDDEDFPFPRAMYHVNPVYRYLFGEDYEIEFTPDENDYLNNDFEATYVDYATAATVCASNMAARNSLYYVYVKMPLTADVWLDFFNIEAQASKHTGNPVYGDYIEYQYAGSEIKITNYTSDSSYFYVTWSVRPDYYTTASQESQVTSTVNGIISSLGLNSASLSNYEKICKIYNYLCQTIKYDRAHMNDESYKLQFTAYGALCQNTAVCQGIAVAFYRLCLASGVTGVRVVTSDPMCHAWNIVDPGVGKYYFVDATWDLWENGYSANRYDWFLRGQTYYGRYHTAGGVSEMGDITPVTWYPIDDEYVSYYKNRANAVYLIDTKDFDPSVLKPIVKITLPAPVITAAANYADYIKVMWNPVAGAENYRLSYRKGSEPWIKVCDTAGTRYNITAVEDGAVYTFKVECFSKDGKIQMSNESNRIGQVRLTTPDLSVKRYGTASDGGFTLNWSATTGGSCYKVYYREKGGTWANYVVISKNANTTFCNIKTSVTNTTSYLPNLIAGHTYEFMVLTATSQTTITSGYPTTFISLKF